MDSRGQLDISNPASAPDGVFSLVWRRPKAVVSVAMLGLAVRIVYVLVGAPRHLPFTDALSYQLQANFLATGHGFVSPVLLALQHQSRPTAAHPPLYVLFLATGSLLGAKSILAHQLMGCLIGTATVVGCGLIGSQLGSDRTGLAAMVVAALYPSLWITDGGIMSEALFALLTVVVTVAAYHYALSRSLRAAILLGVTIGLAVLTRDAGEVLLIVLVLPLVLTGPPIGARPRLVRLLAVFAAAGIVVTPWVLRNLVTFDRPVLISTGSGTLLGANCPAVYSGSGIGLWYLSCYDSISVPPGEDESVASSDAQHAGLTYMRHHLSELPLVVAARVGRTWEVYQPIADTNNNRDDGRPHWAAILALWSYFVVVALAGFGLAVLIRNRVLVLPLAAQIVAVTITAATVWGSVRFRAPAEPILAVLAGVTLSTVPRGSRYLWSNGRSRD